MIKTAVNAAVLYYKNLYKGEYMKEEYYDEKFEYEGNTIKYLIGDEFNSPIYRHTIMIKAQRFINFFDVEDHNLGAYPYYGEIEEITNISQQDALECYKKMIERDS